MTNKTLKPFQLEDAQTMASIGNCINGSEPGVGKTAIAISLLDTLRSDKNLILTPKSVLRQFESEILAFKPELNPIVVVGTPIKRKAIYKSISGLQAFTLIMTYDTMKLDYSLISIL